MSTSGSRTQQKGINRGAAKEDVLLFLLSATAYMHKRCWQSVPRTTLCVMVKVYSAKNYRMTTKDLREGIHSWKFTRERIINLTIGFSAVLIYEFLARPIYRPYIYRNNINDFHLADTIGNSLGTMATIFVLIGFIGQGRTQNIFLIKTITISVALYELAHPLLGKTIDPWDILATLLTGGLCLMLYKFIHPTLDKEQKRN